MTLVKYKPRRERSLIPREFGWPRDLFDWFNDIDSWFPRTLGPRLVGEEWQPAVDVFERNGDLVVTAEIPGVDAKDIHVTVTDDVLRLRGERTQEDETKEGGYYRRERFHGTFERAVPLPAEVDPDKIRATHKNGLLEVVLPKAAAAQTREIEVKVK